MASGTRSLCGSRHHKTCLDFKFTQKRDTTRRHDDRDKPRVAGTISDWAGRVRDTRIRALRRDRQADILTNRTMPCVAIATVSGCFGTDAFCAKGGLLQRSSCTHPRNQKTPRAELLERPRHLDNAQNSSRTRFVGTMLTRNETAS
jgi:hypothetical protein